MAAASNPPEIRISRKFNVPREKVYQAWTQPDVFRKWWGTPGSLEVSLDVRPGGRWSAPIEYEGNQMPFHGYYFEVVENERLVFSLSDEPDAAAKTREEAGDEAIIVEFVDAGGGTEMVFTQKSELPPDQIEEATSGWNAWFDALEEYFAKS